MKAFRIKQFTALLLLILLPLGLCGCALRRAVGLGPRAEIPTVAGSEASMFSEGFCPMPSSEEELRTMAEAGKRYDESYLPDRVVTEVACRLTNGCAIYIREVAFDHDKETITAYVADIYFDDISRLKGCVLRDGAGNLTSGSPEDVVAENDVLFLLNGDYLSIRNWGLYVRNGELVRNKGTEGIDVCVIKKDGSMIIENGDTFDTQACLADKEVWHVISFGPSLLNEDGSARNEDSQFHITDKYSRYNQYTSSVGFPVPNPRAAIGQAADGHYILVAVDGRNKGHSKGMTFPELSHLMYEEGAVKAYNLDGGGSVYMYFDGQPVNVNKGSRNPSDYFCILNR